MLSVDQALAALERQVPEAPTAGTITLQDAQHRILAAKPQALINLPPDHTSAMDGFAIAHKDLQQNTIFKVSARQAAGETPVVLTPNTAVRVFTGSVIPSGADTVVIQEDCEYDDEQVRINTQAKEGANIRVCGEDISQGDNLLAVGKRLSAADIALLSAAGIDKVNVYRRLHAKLLVTGNELVSPGMQLQAGQIYDSNTPMLEALLQNLGFTVTVHRLPDDYRQTIAMLKQAAMADVVITTGGVSVGEEDHIRAALSEIGAVDFWKIAIKPGKPLLFGHINNTPIFGLPGNPVSALITFGIIAKPFLVALQGDQFYQLHHWQAAANFNISKTNKRQQYLRGSLQFNVDKQPEVTISMQQGSAALSSLSSADVLIIIPSDTIVNNGDKLQTVLLQDLFR